MAIENKPVTAPVEVNEAPTAPVQKRTSAKEKASGKPAGFCVYIGPTIIGVVQKGTVYRGSKKEVLASLAHAVEKFPLIATLVVPGETLAADRIKVNTPGNLLYVNYHKLMAGKK